MILCSGTNGNIDKDKTLGIRIDTFAQKPLLKEGLAKAVRKALDEAKD